MKQLVVLTAILCLTGCAGSAYRLPEVNEADIRSMESKIAANKTPLKIYERSDKDYKQRLATISNRLRKNAKPLCQDAGYDTCSFLVEYNAGNEVNAYASEGYKITVYRGLLKHLKNNDEIAAVVAHEMGHHLAKHNEEKQQNAATGAAVSGIITAVLLAAANSNNPYYNQYQQQQDQQTVENMMSAGAGIGALSYSKEQEREADLLATYLLSRAGYNLNKAQNIMLVLAESNGESSISQSAFLDSHPAGVERFVAWDKAIKEVEASKTKLPIKNEQAEQKLANEAPTKTASQKSTK